MRARDARRIQVSRARATHVFYTGEIIAYKNDFLKRRPPGQDDQIERDMGVPLKEAEHQAQGRPEWRRITRRRAKGTPSYAAKSSKSYRKGEILKQNFEK